MRPLRHGAYPRRATSPAGGGGEGRLILTRATGEVDRCGYAARRRGRSAILTTPPAALPSELPGSAPASCGRSCAGSPRWWPAVPP
ncbi:hypothetical protein CSW62_03820 [Caulobacter sp. FWC2]|nr:hypothetical protein CSW62_03820 [Caulobacter sp. FWC2]